jgi:hypothetical protein
MASASKSIPFVARPQVVPAVEIISQTELAMLLSLQGRLSQLEKQVETAEASIRQRLEQGASVEEGDHSAKLATNFRRNVAWKSVAERLAYRFKLDGKAFCARVLAGTRPTPAVSLDIE